MLSPRITESYVRLQSSLTGFSVVFNCAQMQNVLTVSEISDSRGGEFEDDSLFGYCVV
jgi:hypothetical protein